MAVSICAVGNRGNRIGVRSDNAHRERAGSQKRGREARRKPVGAGSASNSEHTDRVQARAIGRKKGQEKQKARTPESKQERTCDGEVM
jgi:hypothetical protein